MASAVPRRLYADFCNKIGPKRTSAARVERSAFEFDADLKLPTM
jgi:hypothetical protein